MISRIPANAGITLDARQLVQHGKGSNLGGQNDTREERCRDDKVFLLHGFTPLRSSGEPGNGRSQRPSHRPHQYAYCQSPW